MPHLQVCYPARTRGQLYIPVINVVLCVATLAVLLLFRDSEHISAAYGLALTITMITTTILLGIYLWHRSNKFGAVVFTIVFLAIQVLFFAASMAKFLHGGWFTLLLTLAILMIMYTWNEGTKLERSQRRHMMPKDFLPALDKLHGDSRIHRFADNIVYLTSDPDLKRLDTDIFFSIFADHPKRARAWWAVAVETTDEPFTREYSVESFGTDYLFRVRIRLGFKVSQSIPAYLHQIMHDLEKTGELPNQQSIYPKLDADPGIGHHPLRGDPQGADARVEGLRPWRPLAADQVRDPPRGRFPGQVVRPGAVQPAGRGAAAVRVHAPPAAPDPRGQPGAQARGLSRQAEQPVRAGWPNGMSGGREPSSYGSRPLHMRMMQSGRYCL